jgi:hypothetical protein
MHSRTPCHLIADYVRCGAYLAKSLLFFYRHFGARTTGCHNLDRRVAPSCSCHISANASHIELCALSTDQLFESRMSASPFLWQLPLQVQHPFIPILVGLFFDIVKDCQTLATILIQYRLGLNLCCSLNRVWCDG